jgi:putative ABC transport system substrate-binding protein
MLAALEQGLATLGYVEGKNIVIERRFADGKLDQVPVLAADLVGRDLDIIVSANTATTIALRRTTTRIPVVFILVSDPVGAGFVESLAHPGGNLTGTTQSAPELTAKRLQILKDAFPAISRTAVFTSQDSVVAVQFPGVERAAKTLHIELLPVQIPSREDFGSVLAAIRKWRADSVYCLELPFTFSNRTMFAEFAAQTRLPAIYAVREYAQAGGLMSYGVSYPALYFRAASYVDKILKGAKPSELPVELPTKFELIINMTTAKTLGIRLPTNLVTRADELIGA